MKTSEQINELAAALSKAQGELKNIEKGKLNPHLKSKYADIADGLSCLRSKVSDSLACIWSIWLLACCLRSIQKVLEIRACVFRKACLSYC